MVNDDSATDSAKTPPIILSDVNDISEMLAYLNSKIKRELYYYKNQRNGHVRVRVKSIEEFRKLVKTLSNDCVKYHTYQLKENRAFRVVIKFR